MVDDNLIYHSTGGPAHACARAHEDVHSVVTCDVVEVADLENKNSGQDSAHSRELVQYTGRAQRRSCERFARYARYRQTDLQTD